TIRWRGRLLKDRSHEGVEVLDREITVYTKQGCGPCLITKKFLTEHGIPFKEINVSEQPSGLVELQERGIKSVPVVLVGDNWDEAVVGFQQDRLEELVR